MTYFLDANIISYLLKGNAAVLKKLEELAEDDNQFGIKTTKQYFANALRIGGAAEPFRSVAKEWSAVHGTPESLTRVSGERQFLVKFLGELVIFP